MTWFAYIAHAAVGDSCLIKVGATSEPRTRLSTIAAACPWPVDRTAFAIVGRESIARRLVARVLAQFASHITSPNRDWLFMPVGAWDAVETRVHAEIVGATARAVEWHRSSADSLRIVVPSGAGLAPPGAQG